MSFPMNINMAGIRWFVKMFVALCFEQNSRLSIGRVNNLISHNLQINTFGIRVFTDLLQHTKQGVGGLYMLLLSVY